MASVSDLMNMNLSKLQELVKDREAWHAVVHGVAKSRTWLSDWTELNWTYPIANASGNCHVSPANQGSPRPQHISLVKFAPMQSSQCLVLTRHSVSSDCRGTSIFVDIEKQRTHLSSCPKKLESRRDKRKIFFFTSKVRQQSMDSWSREQARWAVQLPQL